MVKVNMVETGTLRAGFVGGGFMAGIHSRAVRAAFGSPVAVVSSSSSSDARTSGTAPDGLPQFTDGLRAAQLTSAVQRSARERSWQQIPD